MQEVVNKKREKKKGFDIIINNSENGLNENIQFNFGSIDDKKFPKSIYINSTFWFELNKEKIIENFENDNVFNRFFRKSINDIFKNNISTIIKNNNFLDKQDDAIFYYDIPNNIFYSDKKCFCSLELTLYTKNLQGDNIEFIQKDENPLYNTVLTISKSISNSDFFKDNENYKVFRRKK
jgi:hypothetical protein